MRRSLFAVSVLSALALSGLHCAYADPQAASGCPTRSARNAPVPKLEIVDGSMRRLSTFSHDGRSFVLGEEGQRYWIHIVNPTPARIEAVVSVDGLDAVDGKPASYDKRGYIVPAYGDVMIDGWRTSLDSVATFRFSSVADSYAARTDHERNVGVIGAAFFRERPRPRVVYAPLPPPPSLAPEAVPMPPERGRAESDAPRDVAPSAAGAGTMGAPQNTAHGASSMGASKSAAAAPSPAAERPGLGTEFGESAASSVVESRFVRESARPTFVSEVRYDDRDGLLSRGIRIDPPPPPETPENALRDTADPFPASRFAQSPP